MVDVATDDRESGAKIPAVATTIRRKIKPGSTTLYFRSEIHNRAQEITDAATAARARLWNTKYMQMQYSSQQRYLIRRLPSRKAPQSNIGAPITPVTAPRE